MWVVNKIGKKQVWYEEKLIKKIKDFCVKAQDNTGALIYKMIEQYEKERK